MKTLVIIDLQNDFTPGGSLPVPGGNEILSTVNRLQHEFDLVIATQDWHPRDHSSFAANHRDKNNFDKIDWQGQEQILWPVHCVQNSQGANFHNGLETAKIETVFRKGTNPGIDSYSGFYDNAHLKSTGLAGYLNEKGAKDLYFCGLAAEYCVYYSIIDAISEGFNTFLVEDATRALNLSDFAVAKKNILGKGGKIINSTGFLAGLKK